MNDTRYIDSETGKLRDSARSEMIGGLSGALAGTLAINALGEYGTYKEGLTEQARIPQAIEDVQGVIEKDRLDLEMADLARAYQTDPSVLDQYPEASRDIIKRDIDLMSRLHEREKWDRFNEFPLKERTKMFLKGKPSLDGFDLNVADELTGIYGPQPLHPEVSGLLRDEIARNEQNVEGLRALMDEKVRYDWRRAAPSLDHVKPRNLFRTITNPYVTTGLFTGALGGTVFDEYKKHKANIEQREAAKLEKSAAFKLPKLKLPKPKGPEVPDKAPLVPKNVKRVGILAGAAGVAGYTGIKGVQQYKEGAGYAERIQNGGVAAKSPDQLRKERERMMKNAHETNQEGMDLHMKTAHEKYLELEKVAGIGNTLKKGLDQVRGTNVKQSQKMLDDMTAANASAPMMDAAQSIHAKQKKATNTARLVAGGTVAAGVGGAGLAVSKARTENQKTAYEIYLDLEKEAAIGDGVKRGLDRVRNSKAADKVKGAVEQVRDSKVVNNAKDGLASAGAKAKQGLDDISGKEPRAMRNLIGEAQNVGANPDTIAKMTGELEQMQGRTNKARAIAGGAVAAGAAGAGGAAVAASKRRDEEKTAYETYLELEKMAGIPGSKTLKKGWDHLSGKKVKDREGVLETAVAWGDDADSIQMIQDSVDHAKKTRNIARGAVAGGVVAGAGGAAYAVKKHRDGEKTAYEMYLDLEKMAGIPGAAALKKGMNHLTGKNVKFQQGMLDDSIKVGDSVGTIQMLQKNVDQAKKTRNAARGGVAGGVAVGAAGTAGGVVAAKSNEREKIARDVAIEDSQYALEHPFKKSMRDFAGTGAGVGATTAGLAGLGAGALVGGLPGAAIGGAGGAALGALGGGLVGGAAGFGAATSRDAAMQGLEHGQGGAISGALGGAGFGGAVGLATANLKGSPRHIAGNIGGHSLVGAGIGSLVGKNQERHFNNVQDGEFATTKEIQRRQLAEAGAGEAIDKAAEEVINELFKEASAVIDEAPMEKVATVTSPISKIDGTLFGYDRLK